MPVPAQDRHDPRRRLAPIAVLLTGALIAVSCSGGDSSLELGNGTTLTEAEFLYGRAPERHPDVTYADDVVLIGGGAESVRSVTADGLTWTIDAEADGADELEVGKVFFVTGKGVGRVHGLERDGDDLAVTIAPVELTEVIHDGFFEVEDQPIEAEDFIFYDTGEAPWSVANISSGPDDDDAGGEGDGAEESDEDGGAGDEGGGGGSGTGPPDDEADSDDEPTGTDQGENDGEDEGASPPLGSDPDMVAMPALPIGVAQPLTVARSAGQPIGDLAQTGGESPTTTIVGGPVDDDESGDESAPTVPPPPRPEDLTRERLAEEYPDVVNRTPAPIQPRWAGSRPVSYRDFRVEPILGKDGVGAEVRYDKGGIHIRAGMNLHLGTPSVGLVLDIKDGVVRRAAVRVSGATAISYSLDMWTTEQFAIPNNPQVRIPLPEFGIPLQIGPVPFTLALGTAIQVGTGFSSKDANLTAGGQWRFSGGIGFDYQNGAWQMIGPSSVRTSRSLVDSITGTGFGATAVLLALEVQAKAALGWPGLNVGPFVSLISSIHAGRGSDLGMIVCQSGSINLWVRAGIGWRIPTIVATIVNLVLSAFDAEAGIAEEGAIASTTESVLRKSQFLPNAKICQP